MVRVLRILTWVMGVACALIAIYHLILGQASVPGTGSASATIDSRERFYSAIFLGFALAWIWAARQSPLPARAVRVLSTVFLLGGVGRVVSWIDLGPPHWLQIAEMVVELLLPVIFYVLAAAAEKDLNRRRELTS